MHAARRQLAAVRVEGELSFQRDPGPALDEGTRLTVATDAEGFEPGQRQEREAVVELGHVDVARCEIGVTPHLRGGFLRGHLRVIGPLIPAPIARGPAECLDPDDRAVGVVGEVRGRNDESDGAVDRYVTVEETEWVRDHPCTEVVLERERLAVGRIRVEGGVTPAVDGKPTQLLLRRPVEIHVTAAVHGEPIGGRVRVHREERSHPLHPGKGGGTFGCSRGSASSVAAGTAFGHDAATHHQDGPVDEHVSGLAVRHGTARRQDRGEQAAGGRTLVGPAGGDTESRRHPRDLTTAHRGDRVELRRLEAGIGDGCLRCARGQVTAGDPRSATDPRHPDA